MVEGRYNFSREALNESQLKERGDWLIDKIAGLNYLKGCIEAMQKSIPSDRQEDWAKAMELLDETAILFQSQIDSRFSRWEGEGRTMYESNITKIVGYLVDLSSYTPGFVGRPRYFYKAPKAEKDYSPFTNEL